jgi:hypothetical protein
MTIKNKIEILFVCQVELSQIIMPPTMFFHTIENPWISTMCTKVV